MSETPAESDFAEPGTDLEPVEGVIEPEDADYEEPQSDEIEDAEFVDPDHTDVEPYEPPETERWAETEEPAGFDDEQAKPEPRQGPNDGARPSGGGGGGNATTSRTKSKNPFRRRKTSGSGGRGDLVLFKREIHKTTNASLVDGRGAAVIKATGNKGIDASPGSNGRRPRSGKRR